MISWVSVWIIYACISYIYAHCFGVLCFVVMIFCISCWDPHHAFVHILMICVCSLALEQSYEINLHDMGKIEQYQSKTKKEEKQNCMNNSWDDGM